MIVKYCRRKDDSNYIRLIRYMFKDEHAKDLASISNVGVSDSELAAQVIEATQALNTRARSDKTYHLIVGFHPDDQIDQVMLAAIEKRLCRTIGFEDHQRISVLRTDTEHTHLHVAINKIHPDTLTIHSPAWDAFALSREAAQIEQDYGLVRVKGRGGINLNARTPTFEEISGQESWQTFICQEKRDELSDIRQRAQSWGEFHAGLAALGINYQRKHGGGVLTNNNGAGAIKGSDLGAEFGFKQLIAAYGAFEVPGLTVDEDNKSIKPKEVWVGRPNNKRHRSSDLWQQYGAEQKAARRVKQQKRQQLRAEKEMIIQDAADLSSRHRQRLRFDQSIRPGWKRPLYQNVAFKRRQQVYAAKNQYAVQMAEMIEKHPTHLARLARQSSKPRQHASAKNATSRQQNSLPAEWRNYHRCGCSTEAAVADQFKCSIGKRGQVLYRLGDKMVTGEANSLKLKTKTEQDIVGSLHIARALWGTTIELKGSDQFCRKAATLSGAHGLDIKFSHPGWEKIRQTVHGVRQKTLDTVSEVVQGWIDKRNVTWAKGAKMLGHKMVSNVIDAEGVYRGMRRVGQFDVVLWESGGKMLVQRVPSTKTADFKAIRVGQGMGGHSREADEHDSRDIGR